MKKLLALLVFLFTLSASCALAESRALVVYFSMPEDVETVDAIAGASIVVREGEHLGNVQFAAQIIARETGADLFRIETVEPYPLVHDVLVDQAAQEQDDHFRPTLADHLPDLSAYDTILLGYPNWWADLPMALYTFLEQTDLSGKTVIPFTVHGGSGFSDTVRTIVRLQPEADVRRDGLSISRNAVAGAEGEIAAWARGLGIMNENAPQAETVRIRVTAGDLVLYGETNTTQSAQDFARMLPLRVPVVDYYAFVKAIDLPEQGKRTN